MALRVLPFAGIHNFRDYGDYAADGGRLRTGLLFRSAQHIDATPADLLGVGALDLVTVIDLRGASERAAAPCPRPPGFAAEVLAPDGETVPAAAPHVEAASGLQTPDDARAAMALLYRGLPFRAALVDMMQKMLRSLASRDGASLVHCVAGKDRTGVAVAVLHRMLGVHADDIMADYLLTNQAGNIEARLAAGARTIRARYGSIGDETVRVLMSVTPGYLAQAFEAIDDDAGGFEAYLANMLGITASDRAQIAERLIA